MIHLIIYFRAFGDQKSILNECYYLDYDEGGKSTKEYIKQMKNEVKSSYNSDKINFDNLNAHLEPGSGYITGAGQQAKVSYTSTKTVQKDLTTNDIECSTSITPKKRLSLCADNEVSSNSKQPKLNLKNMSRHSHPPSQVNLKRIRAVLARGDPYPIHLTKPCINNISPDLQKEKL